MRVRITYEITGEEFEALMKNNNIEHVEILIGDNILVEKWLEDHNINGHAVIYAHERFCKDNPEAEISLIKFSKAVRATGLYITKNLRIGDAIQRCFVALDGRDL